MKFSTIAGAAAVLASRAVASVPTIEIKGSKFFYSNNGTQFFVQGVAYQQPVTSSTTNTLGFIDPLADLTSCQRDIPYLLQLSTNVIRVYSIDPTQNHDDCMNAFADAGIYVFCDLSNPDASINRNTPEWNTDLYSHYTSVIDNMNGYSNLLGFNAGNEVTNSANTTAASTFVKAAVRDSKAYIKSKNYRSIGVGYAAADVSSIRSQLADFFNCGSTEDSVDFFGDNVYEWCGDSSYTTSGYNILVQNFSSYSVPYFFAEYGCNTIQPRTFTNIPVLFSDPMDEAVNGGIVYEYFQDTNNYGLVQLSGNSVSKLTDFAAYQSAIAKANPTGVSQSSYSPTNIPAKCPTVDAVWQANSNLPPTPNSELCSCMIDSLTCVVNNSTSTNDYGKLFSQLFGYGATDGIAANGTSGVYGSYSMCSASQRLSFAFNAYYESQNSDSSACDFSGAATTKASQSPTGTCSALLNQAGSGGTGTVTSSPSGISGGSSSSTSSGAARPLGAPNAVFVGTWQIAVYVVIAMLSGAGMILL